MELDPSTLAPAALHKLLIGSVVPRPIAWVSTLSRAQVPNLAPFSYFNIASTDPPMLLFCPQRRPDGGAKDTLRNVLETGEFVIHVVSEALAEPMNQSSAAYPTGISEIEQSGLSTVPSNMVTPPRIRDAPVAFECRVQQLVPLDETGGSAVVIGRVLYMHIADAVYQDGYIKLDALKPIARLAGHDYARVTDTFALERPVYRSPDHTR